MWKRVAVVIAAVAIAASAFVVAQAQTERQSRQNPVDPQARDGGPAARWEPSAEDRRAFSEARLAGLKAGLALTPEQEKYWADFEQAAREAAKLRSDRRDAMRNWQPTTDPAERLRRRAEIMSEAGAAMRKLADAIDPLYKSLDDGQKRRFAVLSRFGRMLGMDGPRFDRDGRDRDAMFDRRDRDGMRMHRWGPRRDGERMRDRDDRDNRDERDGRSDL